MVLHFLLLSCCYRSLNILCLGGFGLDDCIAEGVILSAALGIIYSHDSRQCHTWKEAVTATLLSVFWEDLTNFLVKPKRARHDLIVEAQYPRAPTSTAKNCTDHPFVLIPENRGSYFPNLVACHDSMFSLQGQVTFTIITVFVVIE